MAIDSNAYHDRPTLQQLRYLVAVADHEHFGRAAASCFVSQPALSAQVRELEHRLGANLIERSARHVHVTEVGRQVVERARTMLREVDELGELARGELDGIVGPLHIGVIPTLSPYLLPRVVAVTHAQFADAEIQLSERITDELVSRLRKGTIDLALLATSVEEPDVVTEPIGVDPFFVALPRSHPLAGDRGPLTLDDLANTRMLLLSEGHCLRDQAEAVCFESSLPIADMQGTSLTTVVQMVAAGQGATLLPAVACAVEARPESGIVIRPLAPPAPHRTVVLAWRKRSPRAAHYHELARLLRPLLPGP